jgi:hypothetical protein
LVLVAHFIRISQRDAEQALSQRRDRDDMLAVGQNDARQRHAIPILHGVADHGECVDAGLSVGCDVVRVIDVALVDFILRHEAVDVDGMGAFDSNGFQFVVFDLDIFALFQLITTALPIAFDDVAGLGVDHLLLQPVAGPLVDQVKAGFVDLGRGRIKQHRT